MTAPESTYLIIGAGASGMAFADTLLDEDPDCRITFVGKHARPSGPVSRSKTEIFDELAGLAGPNPYSPSR